MSTVMLDDIEMARPVSIGSEAYTSEGYARREADKLWPRVWQHACRVEEIPNVGDYVTYDILNDTILIVRSESDKISAFYNVCAHRGRRLADGCGHTRQFRCSYHAWRYNLKGQNTHVLDKADWGESLTSQRVDLVPVSVDTWGGWVWINMDPAGPSLREYLEPAAGMLDPFELEKMRYRWRMWCYFDCNWKTAIEAFMEAYHVEGTHPQLLKYADFHVWSKAQGLHGNDGFEPHEEQSELSSSSTSTRAGKGGDARVSIAQLQEELYRTTDASTTQTLVNAAARLVDELPEGTPAAKVVAHWLDSARRDDAARGVIWPTIDVEHMARAGLAWNVFPNLSILHGVTFALCYRARPHGFDPNKCIFEVSVIERYPPGEEPRTQWVYADPGEAGRWPLVLRQDFANMSEVQKGMRSRGFRSAVPNPKQERKVSNFHRNLANYVGSGAPHELKAV